MTTHVHAGRIDGVYAELGTVLGPKAVTREFVVATGTDEQGTEVGYARRDDLEEDALRAMAERGPRSVTEHEMLKGWQVEERVRLRELFGGRR